MNIVLIGFMGSGKSTAGKALAKEMAMDFVDTDEMIEKRCLLTIPDIFSQFGEAYFRQLEREIIKELDEVQNTVISVGGGAIMLDENYRVLKKIGKTIFLNPSLDKIIMNLNGKFRPLVGHTIQRDRLNMLLMKRMPIYLQADYELNTSELDVDETVKAIIELLSH